MLNGVDLVGLIGEQAFRDRFVDIASRVLLFHSHFVFVAFVRVDLQRLRHRRLLRLLRYLGNGRIDLELLHLVCR